MKVEVLDYSEWFDPETKQVVAYYVTVMKDKERKGINVKELTEECILAALQIVIDKEKRDKLLILNKRIADMLG